MPDCEPSLRRRVAALELAVTTLMAILRDVDPAAGQMFIERRNALDRMVNGPGESTIHDAELAAAAFEILCGDGLPAEA